MPRRNHSPSCKPVQRPPLTLAQLHHVNCQHGPHADFSQLSELPGEIRNEIYKYAVTNTGNLVYIKSQSLTNTRSRRFLSEKVDEEFSAYFWRRWRHRDTRNKFRNLRLLRVCKTMYRESADFIYGQRFKFYRLVTLQTFLLLLRPATLARLRHVKVCLGDSEWQLLPMFSTHLIQLINLTTLKITDINTDICRKNFVSYLQRTDRPLSSWEITGDSLDKLNGIKLARDIYPFMFPFFKMMVRDNGIGRLVQMVDFRYQENYSCLGKEQIYRGLWVASPFDRFKARRITDERRLLMRTAMGEEIIRLMEEDSF